MDIFYPLAAGSEIHILSEEDRKNTDAIIEYVRKHDITGVTISTAMGMILLNSAPDMSLDYIMLGGEKMLPSAKTDIRIINGYGPTEFTVCSSYHVVDQKKDTDIPIGRPVPNSYSLICDKYGNLMPEGIAGELCLAGPQIAEGYWNRPELTSERFAPLPGSLGNEAVYRTGDLVRYDQDSNLEYLGRIDFQVKLRGFRIELGEVENRASQFKGIKQVIALVMTKGETQNLCLYYTADNETEVLMEEGIKEPIITTGGMKLSLFDITDFNNPKEQQAIVIGGRGTYSSVQYDPKALFRDPRNHLYGFPITVYRSTGEEDRLKYEGTGAYLYKVTSNGIEPAAELMEKARPGEQYEDSYHVVQRILYVEDELFTVSRSKVTSYNGKTFKKQKTIGY